MRILVIGAGALGGYYGARLATAGRDVTFLVRPRRAEQIAATSGLAVRSPVGDLVVSNPQLARAGALDGQYDLVLLTCKAYDLDACMDDFAPAMGPDSLVLPVLNGMRHMDSLSARFGPERVLGGRAMIFSTLDADGRVIHGSPLATLDYGEQAGGVTPRVRQVDAALTDAGFTARLREDIMQDMWDKWVLIATVAGSTSLMRAAIGDINRAGGLDFMRGLLAENALVAAWNRRRPSDAFLADIDAIIADPQSLQMASLARDMDKGGPIEADHIFGDLLSRAPEDKRGELSRLAAVYLCARAYEQRRERESREARR